jgi:uncharacterized protein (TIGR03435 family)
MKILPHKGWWWIVSKNFLLKISLALAIPVAFAQTFEVASIKPSPPINPGQMMMVSSRGGPGTNDPELFTCQNYRLKSIVSRAYDIPEYRITAPDWMDSAVFNVSARIPKGATKEQFLKMLQNLLAERFRMKMHFDKKEMPLYELSVMKGGPKFREAVVEPPKPDTGDAPRGIQRDAEGYPILGGGTTMAIINSHARTQGKNEPITWLVSQLSFQLHAPITDMTGLTAKYDIVLSWVFDENRAASANGSTPLAGASEPAGPTLEQAVQAQLGLKLEKKKGPVDIVVVDSAEKTPTEN